ncbi:MAG TPA: pectin acetylesterase-family hydrolase [Myxococcota bacterium]|jgi:hypothetical protein|nr:pectin acetylesterase-family hydrolase [Myxococcota bacterium]
MRRSSPLRRALALLVGGLALGAPASVRAASYPTDTCVARKLEASALACRGFLWAEVEGHGRGSARWETWARARLAEEWARAEAASSGAGVDCADTTVTASAMGDLLEQDADALASTALSDPQHPAHGKRPLGRQRVQVLDVACGQLLRAEARHLEYRANDRDRARLERQRDHALDFARFHLERLGGGHGPGSTTETALAQLGALVHDAVLATTVSPNVAQQWTMIDPPDQIAYLDQTLEPICSGGTPWVFFVKRGTVNNLLVYYQGGGACWDYLTCGVVKPYKQTTGPSDDPANATSGLADLTDPRNPFRDWNLVFVPYCTGDVHWGDATYVHELNGNQVTIQHKGFVNAQVAEKWSREHFVHPDHVFVTGSSAGAYGAILHSLYLQEGVYPSADFAVLGDAGNGVITQDFLATQISKWGVEKHLPSWIPELAVPIAQLDASDLYSAGARTYPTHRFATYTTAFDGGTGGQTGFYQIMRNPGNILVWLNWWESSCAWNEGMRALNAKTVAQAPNYRYYVGSGSRHTMWGSDKVYVDTTGGVPTVVSWLEAMLAGAPSWTNVSCTNCGVTLPGDPKPNPLVPPFDANGNVVCPGAP